MSEDGSAERFGPPLPVTFYLQDTLKAAKALLGCTLVHADPEGLLAGRITETEAYTRDDPASHAFRGQTTRNAPMFGPPGRAYIYLAYGMYPCFNAVTAPEGAGEAVLIRALEPLTGVELMQRRRGLSEEGSPPSPAPDDDRARVRLGCLLCGGPGKLCQALGLDRPLNGCDLTTPARLWIARADAVPEPGRIVATPRIGISQGADLPWRFYMRDNPYLSRKS